RRHVANPRPDGVSRRLDLVVVRHYSRKPAIVAVMKFANVPANIARIPRRARSWRRLGASAPIPPIWMPIDPKFANPHKANVAIVNDFGSSAALIGPSCEYATNSLRTMRVPSKLPMAGASFHGTPMLQATGASTQPK